MTVSASSARVLSESANVAGRASIGAVELRRGGRARAGSYLYNVDIDDTILHALRVAEAVRS